ncbi:MAG: hypothetical protein ACR2PX_00235 [Endozoicomonas sp.]|uniref:hypothetical protein n=1 Tax=Endozoicomonas sp. TaxID=1892382 RepID=UPI003D9B404B
MKRIVIFLLIYSTNSFSGALAYKSSVQSFTIAAFLMTGVFKYDLKGYISDLTLHKQDNFVFSSDKEKPTLKKKSCISYPINCPGDKKEGSQKNEGQASEQSGNQKVQQTVDSTKIGTKKKALFCGSDGNDPDPPEENQDNPAEKYGAECLPVWKDEQSENTIVFVIKTKNLRVPDKKSDSGHTTPAAKIYIDGQAVTFYIRWGSSESSDPFLVARGENWKTQESSDESPSDESPKDVLMLFLSMLAQTTPQSTLEEIDEVVPHCVLPRVTRGDGHNYIIWGRNNFRLANHPTINIPTISLSSSSAFTGAEALNPNGWSQNSIWGIHVTDHNNTVAISLEEITFQDRADTFLWDGHAMDGWRASELRDHLQTDHNIEADGLITEINQLPAIQGCSHCERISMQSKQLHAFWSSLQTLLDREDCPDELHFKVTIRPKQS